MQIVSLIMAVLVLCVYSGSVFFDTLSGGFLIYQTIAGVSNVIRIGFMYPRRRCLSVRR
jgi:hypothetical protein